MKKMKNFKNPIMPGFYPDPSICRVGNDFYMVNSSFSYFPGIPLSHSRDLVNWKQIANVIHRPEQLKREGIIHSMGIFAPTIRYHKGIFYVICTYVTGGGNFIVTAKNPGGPWSDPVWLDAEGIDPSLFFDDDGKIWYCGTKGKKTEAYYGDNNIWLQQIDPETLQLTGNIHLLWDGALKNAIWPEGPHIYKIGSYYYLLIAEGGTGLDHAITVARSKNITGPWEGCLFNPILTHRHMRLKTPFINVGHGDLIDDPEGNWWMVLLASRPYGSKLCYNLGRETFLVPIRWEEEWPIPETGMVEEEFPFPKLKEAPVLPVPGCEQFDEPSLPLHWLSLQSDEGLTRHFERPGFLRLWLKDPSLRNNGQAGFTGRRQQHMRWTFSCKMEFYPARGEQGGIALVQNHDYQYRMELILKKGEPSIQLIKAADSEDFVVAEKPLPWLKENQNSLVLKVHAIDQNLNFYFGKNSAQLTLLAGDQDGTILSTSKAGGFVGNVLGVFATCDDGKSENTVDVDWVEYVGF